MTVFLQCIKFVQDNKIQEDNLTQDDKMWNQTVELGVKIMLNHNTAQQN